MRFDSHVHSAASPDSQMDPAEAISILRKKNLGVIFTEHSDYTTPVEKADPAANDLPKHMSRDFICDPEVYPVKYEKFRRDDVLLGLEIALTKAFANLNAKTVEEYDYDFIIGSVHFVDGYDIYSEYLSQPQFDDHYRRFLTYSREVVEASRYFDSFGHIDYISRVSSFPEQNILYERYAGEYDALLGLLASRDIALEMNTRRLGDKAAEENLFNVFKRFCQLGGKYATIGSDAHNAAYLGKDFDRGLQITKDAGLTPVYYKKRRRCEF